MILNCEQFRERLANQEMSPAEARELQAHLESCVECKQAAGEYQELRERLAAGRKEAAAALPNGGWEGFEGRLVNGMRNSGNEQILSEPKMKRWMRPMVRRTAYGLAAAIAVAATGLLGYALNLDGTNRSPSASTYAAMPMASMDRVITEARSADVQGQLREKNIVSERFGYVPSGELQARTELSKKALEGVKGEFLASADTGNWKLKDVSVDGKTKRDEAASDLTVVHGAADQLGQKEKLSLDFSELSQSKDLDHGRGADGPVLADVFKLDPKDASHATIEVIGGGGLTKAGVGTITLSGTNSYTGGTTINAGRLLVDGVTNGGLGYYDSDTAKQRQAGQQPGNHETGDGFIPAATPAIAAAAPIYYSVTPADAAPARRYAQSPAEGEAKYQGNQGKIEELAAGPTGERDAALPRSGPSATPIVAPAPVAATAPSTSGSGAQSDATVGQITELKIIRNGTVEFEVRSFDDSYRMIATVSKEEQGYVSSTSSEKLANGKVRGSIVVRVPPQNLDTFLLKIRALGELKSLQLGAQDVTKQYTDLDSELRALRAMESRLIDLIKSGKGEVKDLVEAEKQLGTYRVRIETIEGEMRYYNSLVSMATVTITAYEKDIQTPTAASEQENVALSVETDDVEAKYTDARKVLDDAKGRIVDSELKKHDADQFDAHIVADVPPDKADFVAAQLKQLGKIASYNRDKKQTTTGGVGVPTVEVEHKDTRFSITLYNLANIAPRETAVLTVAVNDVEGTYKKVISAVRQPTKPAADAPESAAKLAGRVVSSSLAGDKPDLMSADLRADVRSDQADAVLQMIRDSGEVLATTTSENLDTASVTSAKRGIQLHLVNIASVHAREASRLTIAVPDVEEAYRKILQMLRPNAPQAKPGAQTRIVASNLAGLQPEQMSADIAAEIKADDADKVLAAIKASGEVMSGTILTAPENSTATWSKRGLELHLVAVAGVQPREVRSMRAVAADVAKSYGNFMEKLQEIVGKGNARILNSQLDESNPLVVVGTLTFDVNRDKLADVTALFDAAGIEVVSKNAVRSSDTLNTLDSKVRFSVERIFPADILPPRTTTTLAVELDDVQKAMDAIEPAAGSGAKVTDVRLDKDEKGRVVGHMTIDQPTKDSRATLVKIHDLGGNETDRNVQNAQVPETRFAKERIDVTFRSHDPTAGVGANVSAGLGTAFKALIVSLRYFIVGALILCPWLLIAWVILKVIRRRRRKPVPVPAA